MTPPSRAARASATATPISSTVNWGVSGGSSGERTPPVVQSLIQSAPARIIVRTTLRISSGLSTMPAGRSDVIHPGSRPDASVQSPWPPVCDTMFTDTSSRGPGKIPSSIAIRIPAGVIPASRAVVTPASRVRRAYGMPRYDPLAEALGVLDLGRADLGQQMHVAVDEARQDRQPGEVHALHVAAEADASPRPTAAIGRPPRG